MNEVKGKLTRFAYAVAKKGVAYILAVVLIMGLVPGLSVITAKAAVTEPLLADTSWYNPSETSYSINNANQLLGLSRLTTSENTFVGKVISLTANIDLSGVSWEPIGNSSSGFSGTFDGQGYVISNLTIEQLGGGNGSRAGFFGRLSSGATIQNVGLERLTISARSAYVGGVCGEARGNNITIKNCYVAGYVIGNDFTGAGIYVGGICGYSSSNIINCYFESNDVLEGVYAYGNSGVAYAGGVCGYTSGSIKNCNNSGIVNASSIDGKSAAGGICGISDSSSGVISYCYNTGVIQSKSDPTFTMPDIAEFSTYAGGICGDGNINIEKCYNSGTVIANELYVITTSAAGGISGRLRGGTIKNCYNTGDVKSFSVPNTTNYGPQNLISTSGGICGYLNDANAGSSSSGAAFISNCYNIGLCSSSSNGTGIGTSASAGGICGVNGDHWTSVANVYWLNTGNAAGIGAGTADNTLINSKGLTANQMTIGKLENMTAFDFSNTWNSNASMYPVLRAKKIDIWLPTNSSTNPNVALIEKMDSDLVFVVNTEYIASGTYQVIVTKLPSGVSAGELTIDDYGSGGLYGEGTLTLYGNKTVKPSTITGMTLIFDETTSNKFTMEIIEYPIKIKLSQTEDYDFGETKTGYVEQTPLDVAVSSVGLVDGTGGLIVSLSGDNPSSFKLSTTSISNVSKHDDVSFNVTPKTGLTAGIHAATVTVSGINESVNQQSFNVKFTVQPSATYAVTVSDAGLGATGSGDYSQGETVQINAGTPPTGQQFKNWTSTDPGVNFADSNSANTSFIMPGNAVTVVANFEAIPTVPSAPTNIRIEEGDGQVIVSFDAPEDDGGSPVTSYIVTSTPGGISSAGSSSPITVTGLTNGTAYTFTVTAVNILGAGSVSSPSNEVTPARNNVLVSIIPPTAVTGLANGTAKTAEDLGLPTTVTTVTNDGNITADVTWDVDGSSYDPANTAAQTFTVYGTAEPPVGVDNPNNISLFVSVSVTVNGAISANKELISITPPEAITGLANGTAKTAAALGLPAAVTLVTDGGNIPAGVTWDVDSCTYDPADSASQFFTVYGTAEPPVGVDNPNNISLSVSVSVTVNGAISVNKELISITPPEAITGLANGTAKTAAALGLPAAVTLVTNGGNIPAGVTWDVDSCTYDPTDSAGQFFTVNGTAEPPVGVDNPNSIPLTVSVNVSVMEAGSGSAGKNLIGVNAPAAISGIPNGTDKTAAALGLPAAVTLLTDGGNVPAAVTWDVYNCLYNPAEEAEQTFTVNGTVSPPNDVANPDGISWETAVWVTVSKASSTGKLLIGIAAPASVTGLVNGTAKTAAAMGLPAAVTLITSGGNVPANVLWDVQGSSYNPFDSAAQTFTVNGTVHLPVGVDNTNYVPLSVAVGVSVNSASGQTGPITRPVSPVITVRDNGSGGLGRRYEIIIENFDDLGLPANAKILIAVSKSGSRQNIISYSAAQKTEVSCNGFATRIEVWLADGMINLINPNQGLGAYIYAHKSWPTP